MLTDTHCHLDFPQFDADREAVMARARAAGVGRIVVPATDLETSRRAAQLAETHADIYAAVGFHPNSTSGFGTKELSELERIAQSPKVVAIGEIGIDLYWKAAPLDEQVTAFRMQIGLANALEKPVIVHDREAHAEVLETLREAGPRQGAVLHSFSGDQAMAETAVELGFYLGVDGPITYKKNETLRAIFVAVPLDRILIETDAPYLTPQAKRGQRNEPAYVRLVAEKLAEVRGMTLEAMAQATTANAARFFGWAKGPASASCLHLWRRHR